MPEYINAEVCAQRCKSTAERLKMIEQTQEMRDEEQERSIQAVSKTNGQLFGKLSKMDKKIDETNERVTSLEKRIPEIVTSAIREFFEVGIGRAVIFVVKTIIVIGVIGGAALAVRAFIFGG